MRFIAALIFLIILAGCQTTQPLPAAKLELLFNEASINLTTEQHARLATLLEQSRTVEASVAPANHDNKFQALLISQNRLKSIRKVAEQYNVPIREVYKPTQTADTVVLTGL